jgi:hypothetical protein
MEHRRSDPDARDRSEDEREARRERQQEEPGEREYGSGLRSVERPTSGCRSEAVTWFVSVMRPTCPKSRW